MEAARRQFGSTGFDRTSLRSIASEAGVDQALILHFFGSKMGLFLEVVALPLQPDVAIPALVDGPRDEIGRRAATLVIGILESEPGRATITALLRAATSEPEAARLVRQRLTHDLWGPLARRLEVDDADLRVSLVGTQIIGVALARYIVRVEPLASLPPEGVVSLIAPTLHRYLVEPLE
jgi:AcrR family transcriptional regulator